MVLHLLSLNPYIPTKKISYNKKRFGRDNFQEALRLSHRLDPSQIDWKKFKYMVFDQPHHKGTYEQAYAELGTIPFLYMERERERERESEREQVLT
jgi:hypothetical protein